MPDILKPADVKHVEQAVQWALTEGKTLEIAGGGTKRPIGRPTQVDLTLELSALTGVTLYEPEELVLSARAGTPLAEIETLVESKNQQLAFEPIHCGRILGSADERATIGGALAKSTFMPAEPKTSAVGRTEVTVPTTVIGCWFTNTFRPITSAAPPSCVFQKS